VAGLTGSGSDKLFEQAKEVMPGGVSSPVRSFSAVGGRPFFVDRGEGGVLVDVDGNRYVDLVQSWGALLFGHANPDVVSAVRDAAARGTSFGTPTELELELARLVTELVPNAELVRFVSSGTEAVMTAVRLARAFTGRAKILKFVGCYHGHADQLLVQSGSGVATLGIPGSPGVTQGAAADTLLARYNDLSSVEELLDQADNEVAAILVEPVAANMGLVLPDDGFLDGLRKLADTSGALLIFDEVITGFRVDPGGAQERFGVSADLLTLGKVLGGGLPAAAIAGPGKIMHLLAPEGDVYQAGTLSGNPLAMAAGIATLTLIRSNQSLYGRIQDRARSLVRGLVDAADQARVPLVASAIGGLAGFFFADDEVADYDAAAATDADVYARFFRAMLERGVYLPPSRFEALFLSAAHTPEHIEAVVAAAGETFAEL
jgi:glutamate-1-semialdehyde 2,1-aminomutase